MPPRLRQDALARVDQHHRKVGGRGAGRHVARILFMAGRVGDDELARRRREEAIGDVDGDALLALGLQPVDQKGEIDVLAGCAELARRVLDIGQLVLEDQLGVVEKAADQGRLAVVHRSAGEEPQQALVLLGGEIHAEPGAGGVLGRLFKARHQKYPSRFFFSMDPASSLSIRRPCRSEVRAVSISPTIFSSVSASDSIAPVSG